MKLVLLGTTGYHPSDTRQTACMMLPECGIVLDAGTAMYRVRDRLAYPTLDIFLTHAHLDHVIGLTFLFDVLFEKPVACVRVHGEAAKLEAIQEHLFSEHLFPARPSIEWHPLGGPVALPQQGELTYFSLKHPGGSLGYRLDWPTCSLAYITDTTAHPAADYVKKIRGVDVLIHECNFPDGWEDRAALTGHSCTSSVARVAREAQVGLLMLVHINPLVEPDDAIGLEAARHIFPNTYIGTDFTEIDL